MAAYLRPSLALAALALGVSSVAGPLFAKLPADRISLHTLGDFRPLSANWKNAGGIAGDPRHDATLAATDGVGVLVCNPGKTRETRGHLFTSWEHGDLELDLEFLLPPKSNSGVYLQGRYEVQLFDSWGKREVTSGDSGGVYKRWDPARGQAQEAFEGTAPRANASRAPGLWQTLRIEFQAPRFDAAGKKTAPARFVRVVLNGFTIHENIEVSGPTRSAAFEDEKPLGPLMIQGDHGPVAIRNLSVKRFDATATIDVADLHYKLYSGDFTQVGSYDAQTPAKEGTPARFAHSAIEKTGKFALVFTGNLRVPRDGAYRFDVRAGGAARLTVAGRDAVTPVDRGSQPGTVQLTAGSHPFRLDVVHNSNGRPSLDLIVEGPGLASRSLTASDRPPREPRSGGFGKKIVVEPDAAPRLQRGFVPFEPRKRLYGITVGWPSGTHFAYDTETASLLHVWHGSFLETASMWEGRGNDQLAKPNGPALTFSGRPAVALIEYPQTGDWPDTPDPLWTARGYTLAAGGVPVFQAALADLAIDDRIEPSSANEGAALERTLRFKGKLPSWSTWVLLADADTITAQPDGRGWIVGDRQWYVDWPASSKHRPVVRSANGRQYLAVLLSNATLAEPLKYSLVW